MESSGSLKTISHKLDTEQLLIIATEKMDSFVVLPTTFRPLGEMDLLLYTKDLHGTSRACNVVSRDPQG